MKTDLNRLEFASPVQSLDSYIHWVQKIPLLTPEEELELAHQLKDTGDVHAAKKLVMSHLRFVVKISRGYLGYGLSLADLIQEGNIGLMKAVKRFNPNIGVRLVSFAVHWIRAEIHEFILRNWRIVKIATTKAQRKLFFNLRHNKKHLGWLSADEVAVMADELGVSEEQVLQMESRLYGQDLSIDESAEEDDSQPMISPRVLEDQRYNPAQLVENENWTHSKEELLHHALAELDPRSRGILEARWFKEPKATLQELSVQYKVSAERIRQLEATAFKQLKSKLQALSGVDEEDVA